MSASSYLTIDGFRIDDLFNFADGPPIIGRLATRSYTGTMYLTDKYYKDTFQVTFPKLTPTQMYQLNQILRQTGIGALHTVVYASAGPNGAVALRKYDGSTAYASGYGINDDVGRLRAQVYATKFSFPHWPNFSSFFFGTINFEEA